MPADSSAVPAHPARFPPRCGYAGVDDPAMVPHGEQYCPGGESRAEATIDAARVAASMVMASSLFGSGRVPRYQMSQARSARVARLSVLKTLPRRLFCHITTTPPTVEMAMIARVIRW